jgi:hypothetical protein
MLFNRGDFHQTFSFHDGPNQWNGSTAMAQGNSKDLPAPSKYQHSIQNDIGIHL